MDAFSYLSVLLSIILGLAMTEILQGYRALLLARGRVTLHATTLIWSVLLLLFATQAWWASFGLRDHAAWNFISFAVILLQMILIYMMAALILPDVGSDSSIDLEAHFNDQRVHFFGFLIAVIVVSIAKDVILDGRLPEAANLLFQLALTAVALAGCLIRDRRGQLAIALFAAAGFAAYVATLFANLD